MLAAAQGATQEQAHWSATHNTIHTHYKRAYSFWAEVSVPLEEAAQTLVAADVVAGALFTAVNLPTAVTPKASPPKAR